MNSRIISDPEAITDIRSAYPVCYNSIALDGVKIGYREAGSKKSPVLFLLHGYRSSSHMFRNIIAVLSTHFYVVAPDLPGFGFSDLPDQSDFNYSFDGYSKLIMQFLDRLNIKKASFYLFDYGAAVLMQIITIQPELVAMLIFQNGNIYKEGVADFSINTKLLVEGDSPRDKMKLDNIFEFNYTRWEYLNGVLDISKIAPESYYLDQFLLERRGVKEIQSELKRDSKTNTELYPIWQKSLKSLQPPTLIVWGENDKVFKKEGALLLHQDLTNSKLIFYPTGHFALEEYGSDIVQEIIKFWTSNFNT